MAKTQSVAAQLENILDEYDDRLKEETNSAMDSVAKQCVSKLKNTSPKKSGKYARSWTKKKTKGIGGIDDVTVHNKQYQLTHLLENGHIIRNKKGEYGRTRGIKHIEPVEQFAISEFPAEIERKMNK